jgi:hypothetical protein
MAIIKRNKTTIYGLVDDLGQINQSILDEAEARGNADGDLAALTTTEKTNLVAAINEVKGAADQVSSDALTKADNLASVADAAAARTNLDVMSGGEIDQAISDAQLNFGKSYNVADIASRDALTGLTNVDRVLVTDDGDSKWALYQPEAIDGDTGAVTSWVKLSDQDTLENAISASTIKQSYESNADTNAFTDAEQTKVGHITVTQAIDLDDAVLKANLAQDLAPSSATDAAPSVQAVKNYADTAARAGGAIPFMETVVISGDDITLTHQPRGGVNGIMNFATVRYTDANGVAWDAPVVATADPKVFTVNADSAGQWDTESVRVQYLYSPQA